MLRPPYLNIKDNFPQSLVKKLIYSGNGELV